MKSLPTFALLPPLLALCTLLSPSSLSADQNATVSGTINYFGPVTGPIVVYAKFNGVVVNTVTLPNGPGPYTMQLPKNQQYEVKAFRDGNGNGNLDPGWQVGEPYAHHGDWNSTTSSFNTLLLDGNKTGIDVNVSWHGDHDGDGFYDWDEYVAGSDGNDSTIIPGIGYGLVAHWTFDETNGTILGDSSGNDVHGTLNGFSSQTNTHWVLGRVGGALHFDGTDDYVSFPGATLLNDLAPMTFAGWVFRETDPDGGYIIAKRSGGAGYWRLNSGNNDLSWVKAYTGEHPFYTSTSPTVLDQWTHVAFTWNGQAYGVHTQLYLDGLQTTNPTRFNGSGSPISDEGNLFTIGNRPDGNISYFKGKLDDFRIWKRVLKPMEVLTLYEAPGFPLTDANFTKAINLWFSDDSSATATYGHIRDWNVSGVTNLDSAFENRVSFNEDISDWNVSNVRSMKYTFYRAESFNRDIAGWDVSAVTDMNYTFMRAYAFNKDIGDWNVSNVTAMKSMFRNATVFNQDIGRWDVSNVLDMSEMFEDATAFNRDVGDWNVSNVTDMSSMFRDATAFNQDVGDWDVSNVTDMDYMFRDATAFNQDIGRWDVSNVTGMGYMFTDATSFNQDVGDWDVSAVTDMNNMFSDATSFNQDVGDWDVSNVTDMNNMFHDATAFNQDIGRWDVSAVTNMQEMFWDASSFNQDIGGWNVSNVTDMSYMFEEAASFDQDIGRWNVSAVTDMTGMFRDATAFNKDVGDWDVSKVTDMDYMFDEAISFNQDIGDWNVSKVTDMSYMFEQAASFDRDLGDWNVSAVTDMNGMFRDATAFNQDIGDWNVGNVTYMNYMFEDAITFDRDIGDWNVSNVTDMSYMFERATSFDQDVGDWNVSGVTEMNGMFAGAESLSDANKALIHQSFSSNATWSYDWSAYLLDLGLVAWYPFDGNASDISGNNHHGTVNGATLGTDRYGRPNEAYSFDGNDWIDLGNVLSRYDLLSFSAWFLANSNGSFQGIVSKPRSPAGTGSALKWGGAFFNNGGSNFVLNADMGATGSWVHGALVHDGSKISVFVNGTLAVHQNLSLNPVTSSESMLIGKELHANPPTSSGGQRYFNGSIDDVRIYDRALSASEVTQLYYLEKPGAVLTDHNFTTAIGLWFSDRNNTLATHGHISNWDVSAVTEMNGTFENRQSFDSDISGWDVSSATDMSRMFAYAKSFNQDIGDWNVSAVTNMTYMFSSASTFNQDIGRWDVSSVTDMSYMFSDASSFNRDVGDWNVSAVTDMEWMFEEASDFNQDIGDWDVSNVTDMSYMFEEAAAFNQDIGRWDVSAVTDMGDMFSEASAFNQDIGDWNVSNVTDMSYMFEEAASFNQDVRRWDVSAVTDMGDMFENASSFDQNLSRWDVSAVTDMRDMFDGAYSLSNYHKGLIHASFSSNSNWPYDWSAFVGTPPHADPVTDDNDNPPPGGNGDEPVENEPVEPSPPPTDPPVLTHAYRPIVRTESPGPSTDAQPLFEGRILTDGGSPILEAGFIVSRNINLQPGFHLIVQPGSGSNEFSATAQPGQLEPGKLYYFRAYALNTVGESIGQIRQFRAPEASNAWWAQMPSSGGGWHTSDWFGTFRRTPDTEWVYHARLGWAYAVSDGQQGLWLWMMDEGWLWTEPGTHPYLFRHRSGSWLYLMGSEAGKPVFFDFSAGFFR